MGRDGHEPRPHSADASSADASSVEATSPAGKVVRRISLRLLAMTVAVVMSGLLIGSYDTNIRDDNYLAAVLEKDRLIRSTPSPKIILVGGSNLAFGVDSKQLQDSLGIRVVNMGLYARLGLRYMLAQVKPYIRRGDVVVVAPEYDQFYGDFANGDNTLSTALLYAPADRIPDFIRSYSVVDVVLRPRVENVRRSFLRAAAAAIGREDQLFPPDTNPVYNRRSFNQYGDVVSHLGRKGLDPDSIYVKALPPLKDFNRGTLGDLNSVESEASATGAHAYFMFPSFIERAYILNVAAIDSLRRKLEGGMKMPIAGTAKDFVFSKENFFDTRYHLTEAGRALRTRKMIERLRAVGRRDGWLRN